MVDLIKVDIYRYLVKPQDLGLNNGEENFSRFKELCNFQVKNPGFQNEFESLRKILFECNQRMDYKLKKGHLKLGFLRPIEAWAEESCKYCFNAFNRDVLREFKNNDITHYIPVLNEDFRGLVRCVAIHIYNGLFLTESLEAFCFLFIKAAQHSQNMLNLLTAMSIVADAAKIKRDMAFFAIFYNNTPLDEYLINILMQIILDFTFDEANVQKLLEANIKFSSFFPEKSLPKIKNLSLHDAVKYLFEKSNENIDELLIRLIAYALNLNIKVVCLVNEKLSVEQILPSGNQTLILIKHDRNYDIGLSSDFMAHYKDSLRNWTDLSPIEFKPRYDDQVLKPKPKINFGEEVCMECGIGFTLFVQPELVNRSVSQKPTNEAIYFSKCQGCIKQSLVDIINKYSGGRINFFELDVAMQFVAVSSFSKERFGLTLKLKVIFNCFDESSTEFLKNNNKDNCLHCNSVESTITLSCCFICKQCLYRLLNQFKKGSCLCNAPISQDDLIKLEYLHNYSNRCCSCEKFQDYGLFQANFKSSEKLIIVLQNRKLEVGKCTSFSHFICPSCYQNYPAEINCKICKVSHTITS